MAEAKPRSTTKKPATTTKSAVKKAPAKAAAKPAAKPAAAKPAATKAVAAKPVATKKAATPKAPAKKKGAITPEQHYRMVAEAAYFIAEKRGFAPGNPAKDWQEAEAQIKATLKG
jgi:hypothetical protein